MKITLDVGVRKLRAFSAALIRPQRWSSAAGVCAARATSVDDHAVIFAIE